MTTKYLDSTGLAYLWGKLKDYFQEKLVSGTNIKTINNTSILGSGNISVGGGTVPTKTSDLTNDSGFITNTLSGVSSGAGCAIIGDILIEWGQVNVTTGTSATSSLYAGYADVTFTNEFKYNPQISLVWHGNYANQHSLNTYNRSTTGFRAYGRTSTERTTRTIGWLAIGQIA